MIHPTAVISSDARIDEGVTIGPFCRVGAGTVLETGVILEAHVILNGPIHLESAVHLFSFVNVGNGHASIHIGSRTHIREFAIIGCQNDSKHAIRIAKDNFIMAYVQLYPGVTLGANCVLTNTVTMQEGSRCEERVIIGGLSTVDAGCAIGTGVMVGGASHLTLDVPPFCLVEGNAAEVRGLNIIGLRRRFDDRAIVEGVKRAFKQLYRDFDRDRAAAFAAQTDNPQVRRFAAFIAAHTCTSPSKEILDASAQ